MRDIAIEIAAVGLFCSRSTTAAAGLSHFAGGLVFPESIIELGTMSESIDLTTATTSATYSFRLAARAEVREVTRGSCLARELFTRTDPALAEEVYPLPSIDASTTEVVPLPGTDLGIADLSLASVDCECIGITADFSPSGEIQVLHLERGLYGTHAAPHYGTPEQPLLITAGVTNWPGRRVTVWVDGIRAAVGEIAENPSVDRDTVSITCTRLDGRLGDPPGDGTERVAHLTTGHVWDVDTYAGIAWVQPEMRVGNVERSGSQTLWSLSFSQAVQIPETSTHAFELHALHPDGTAVQPSVAAPPGYDTVGIYREKSYTLHTSLDIAPPAEPIPTMTIPAYVRWWVGRIPAGTRMNADQAGWTVASAWYYQDRLYGIHHSETDALLFEPLVYAAWSAADSATIIATRDDQKRSTGWPYGSARLALVETYPADTSAPYISRTGATILSWATEEPQSWRCPRYAAGSVASLDPEPFGSRGPLGRLSERGSADVGRVISTYPVRYGTLGAGGLEDEQPHQEREGTSGVGVGYRIIDWRQRTSPTYVETITALAWYEQGVDEYLSLDARLTPASVPSEIRATWYEPDGTQWSRRIPVTYVGQMPGVGDQIREVYSVTSAIATPGVGDWPGQPRAEFRPLVAVRNASSGSVLDSVLSSVDGSTGTTGDTLLAGYASGEYTPHDVIRAISTPGVDRWTLADEGEWMPEVVSTVLSLATSGIVWTPSGFALRDYSHVAAPTVTIDDDSLTSPPAILPTSDVVTGLRLQTDSGTVVVRNPRAAQKRGDQNMLELDLSAARVSDVSTVAAKLLAYHGRYRPTVSAEIAGDLVDTLALLDTIAVESRYLDRTVVTVTGIDRDYERRTATISGVVRYVDEIDAEA